MNDIEKIARQATRPGFWRAAELGPIGRATETLLDLGDGCVVPAGFTLIVGPAGLDRTALALHLAAMVGRVDYYSMVGSRVEFAKRLPAGLGDGFAVSFDTPNLLQETPPWSEVRSDTKAIIDDSDADLLVLDPLGKVLGKAKTFGASAFCRNARAISDAGISVWALVNTASNGLLTGTRIGVLNGMADCLLMLKLDADGFWVECKDWPKALYWRREATGIVREDRQAPTPTKAVKKGSLEDRIKEALKDGPLKPVAIRKAVGYTGDLKHFKNIVRRFKGADGLYRG